MPPQRGRAKERPPSGGLALHEVRHLRQLVELFEGLPRRAQRSVAAPGARR
jgi:hypothetical protein